MLTIVSSIGGFPSSVFAQGTQTFNKTLFSTPTNRLPGDSVIYRFAVSCNSLTANCGNLSISDILPAQLEIVDCSGPSVTPAIIYSCPAGGGNVTITRASFNDGDSFLITLNTRVRLNAAPANNIINSASSTISAPSVAANGTLPSSADPINVLAGTPNYEVRKQRIDPAPPLQIAADTFVRYRAQLCSLSATGNVNLTAASLTDSFSPFATFISAPVAPTGQAGNQISWNLGAVDLATLYAGQPLNSVQCISREFVVSYPALALNTNVDNAIVGSITPVGGAATGLGPVTLADQIGPPTGGANLGKSGPDIVPPGELVWSLAMNNNSSNVPLDNFIVIDTLPSAAPGPFNVTSITSGAWPDGAAFDYTVVADLDYSLNAGGAWTQFATNIAANANRTFTAAADFPATITNVRWRFRNTNALQPLTQIPRGFSFTTSPVIRQTVPGGTPTGTIAQNCLSAAFDAGGTPGTVGPTCDNINIEVPTPAIQMIKERVGSSGSQQPGDEPQFRLRFQHIAGDTTGDIVNPTVADLLPPELEFVSWDSYAGPSGKPDPNLEVIRNFLPGRTLLRWTWASAAPAGSVKLDGTAGVANAATFDQTIAAGDMPRIVVTLRIKAGTLAQTLVNDAGFFDHGPRSTCGTSAADTNNLDGDGTTANFCIGSANIVIISAAVLGGEKWIKGDPALNNVDDPTSAPAVLDANCPDYGTTYAGAADKFTRFPCVARTDHGGTFTYRLRITNTGNLPLDNYVLYDVLPFVGDTGSGQPLSATARDSRWRPTLNGAITPESVPAGATPVIEYSTAANSCRPEASSNNTIAPAPHWQPGCDNASWSSTLPADLSTIRAFRIRAFTGAANWAPGEVMTFIVPMTAPTTGGPPSIVGNAAIFNPAWNSFAHRANEADTVNLLPTAEPRKVGIILPERYRIGNLVWRDDNNNGQAANGEPGISGVQVELWQDTNNAGGAAGPSAGDTKITTKTTDPDGKYFFDTRIAGDYYVVIPNGQVALTGFNSSSHGEEVSPNTDGDNNDNGVVAANSAGGGPQGIASNIVTVGPLAPEPTNEQLRANNATDDDNDLYPDSMSNYSVDFGFYRNDYGDVPDSYGTTAVNNGASHVLIPTGPRLGACVDSEPDGQPSSTTTGDDVAVGAVVAGTCVGSDDEDGVSIGALTAGASVPVTITASDVCRLSAWVDWNRDGDFLDAGEQIFSGQALAVGLNNLSLNVPAGLTAGTNYARFRCATVTVTLPTGAAADGEVEDYLLVVNAFSIGNRVFLDDGAGGGVPNDGMQNGSEAGLANVVVGLYADTNADGQPDDPTTPVVPVQSTDGNGYYLFNNVPEGTYVVQIDRVNFTPGGALVGLVSSIGRVDSTTNILDQKDNGIDNNSLQTRGLLSGVIILGPGDNAPTGETDLGLLGTGGKANNKSNLTVDFGLVALPTGGTVDLVLTKSAGNPTAFAGGTISYLLEIRNQGTTSATGVVVTDLVSSDVRMGAVIPSQGTCTATNLVTCNVGTILPGGVVRISIFGTIQVVGTVANSATVRAIEGEVETVNNASQATIQVVAGPVAGPDSDPGVSPPPTANVPTLSEWGLLILATLLMGVGWARSRRLR